MARYTKEDVRFHSDGFGRRAHPAVNVKAHRFVSADDVVDRYGCAESTAEKALEYTFEMHSESFWDQAPEELDYFFGERHGLKVYQEGRSGGWLIVDGLPPIEEWDAIALSKWARFEKWARAEVDYLCSQEAVFESIDANEWAMDDQSLCRMVAEALA